MFVISASFGDNIIATSNSWGWDGRWGFNQAMYDAIKTHQEEGILFIAAAGNVGSNNDIEPDYPSSYNLTNIISVAASDQNDHMTTFSNYGPNTVHLAAPGVDIYSTVLDNNYDYAHGTSMAAPHVSGLAALI